MTDLSLNNVIIGGGMNELDMIDNVNNNMNNLDDITTNEIVHIRICQRRSRKYLTTISGLASDLSRKRILKAMRQAFNCNGCLRRDKEGKRILQLQGDQRENVVKFLTSENIIDKEDIKIHGF